MKQRGAAIAICLVATALATSGETILKLGVDQVMSPAQKYSIGLPERMNAAQSKAFQAWLRSYLIGVIDQFYVPRDLAKSINACGQMEGQIALAEQSKGVFTPAAVSILQA